MAIESTAGGLDGALVWELEKADLAGCGVELSRASGMLHPGHSVRRPLCDHFRSQRLPVFVCYLLTY